MSEKGEDGPGSGGSDDEMLVAIPVYIMITTREKEKTGDRCRETKLERVRKRSMMAQGQEFLEKFVSYYRMMLTV